MGFLSLYSHSHLPYSPPSPTPSVASCSPLSRGSKPNTKGWNLAADHPSLSLYKKKPSNSSLESTASNPDLCNGRSSSSSNSAESAASSGSSCEGRCKRTPSVHPLLQACSPSSSTTSISTLNLDLGSFVAPSKPVHTVVNLDYDSYAAPRPGHVVFLRNSNRVVLTPESTTLTTSSSTSSLTSLTHAHRPTPLTPTTTTTTTTTTTSTSTKAACTSSGPTLGYSPPSQPSQSINFLKKPTDAIDPIALVGLIEDDPLNILLFDIRSDEVYRAGFIQGAVNVPIPMKKLKDSAFTLDSVISDFVVDEDLDKVERWPEVARIVVYDNDRDGQSGVAGTAAFYLLEKFIQDGWEGKGFVLRGGIREFADSYPARIQRIPIPQDDSDEDQDEGLFVGGGNHSPRGVDSKSPLGLAYINQAAILQDWKFGNSGLLPLNRDSWDKVGGVEITVPLDMGKRAIELLPGWLQKAHEVGGSKHLAEKFHLLEIAQEQRLNGECSTPGSDAARYLLAGSGNPKNRHRDVYPYEHSRVKLVDPEGEDYINASHLSVLDSPRKYIASQAPTPAAFNDFWKMVWEQDISLLVMLTALEEACRTVGHRYWTPGNYGPLKLTCVSDKMLLLNNIPADAWQGERKPKPIMHYISVRKFMLEHEAYPLKLRGITQIQDLAWPDFGVPDDPGHLLRIIDCINQAMGPAPCDTPAQSPVLVMCSAGCGRTGLFCTVDAVVGQLERHLMQNVDPKLQMADLIEETVGRFRDERMSMVQNLRQYIHCYEVALEWVRAHAMTKDANGKCQ